MTQQLEILNVFIPIKRSFESEGRHFVYGYTMLWHTPDMHGTVIDESVVRKSLTTLKRYPSVRYMHKKPIGKILFDEEVEGVSTYIDEKGFHVLAEICPACTEEWEVIRSGQFGFSYGLGFPKTELKRHNGKVYPTFINGSLYEISIVDSPSCVACNVNTIERSRYFIPETSKKYTMRGLDIFEIAEDGSLKLPEPVERKISNPNYEEQARKQLFPEICSEECKHIQCPYRRTENYGKPCKQQWEQYENDEPLLRSLHSYRKTTEDTPKGILKENWNVF